MLKLQSDFLSFKIFELLPHVDRTYPCGRQCRDWKMLERYNSLWRCIWSLSPIGSSQACSMALIVHLNCPDGEMVHCCQNAIRDSQYISWRFGLPKDIAYEFLQHPATLTLWTNTCFWMEGSTQMKRDGLSLRPALHPDPKQKAGSSVALCTADKRTWKWQLFVSDALQILVATILELA